jgi:hypothetical protein
MGSMDSQGDTFLLLSDSEPPQQARRRRYLLFARCKWRERTIISIFTDLALG